MIELNLDIIKLDLSWFGLTHQESWKMWLRRFFQTWQARPFSDESAGMVSRISNPDEPLDRSQIHHILWGYSLT